MAVPKKYQFKVFVKRKLRARLGTFAMAMTSLKDTICTAVTIMMMKMWPMKMAAKKMAIMIKVHIVRVMKVCLFFSDSDSSTTECAYGRAVSDKTAALWAEKVPVGLDLLQNLSRQSRS